MRRLLALVLFSLALIHPTGARAAEWVPLGPFGGIVDALAVSPRDPRVLYAGSRGAGVFRSADGGRSWERRNGRGPGALTDLDILAVAVDPQDPDRVYAGTLRQGLFRSVDGGASWTSPPQGQTAGSSVQAIAVDPARPAIAYASQGGFLLKTVDRGATWAPLADAPYSALSLAFNPNAPRTIYAGNLEGVFRSTDGGATWTSLPGIRGTVYALAVDPRTPSTVYAAAFRHDNPGGYTLFKSFDRGQTWRVSGRGLEGESGWGLWSLAIDPVNPGTVYAGTWHGVYKSTNGGRLWLPSSLGAPGQVSALAVHPGVPSVLWAGTGKFDDQGAGVYRSTDRGATWALSRRGLSAGEVASLAFGPAPAGGRPALYVGSSLQGVFASLQGDQPGRAPWADLSAGLRGGGAAALLVHPEDPAVLYAGTYFGVFRSANAGAIWRRRNQGLAAAGGASGQVASIFSLAFREGDPETLYAGAAYQIFKSTDGGASWRHTGALGFTMVRSIATSPADPDVIYAAGNAIPGPRSRHLYKSLDGGESWRTLSFDGTNVRVAADPADAGVILVYSVGNRLWRSADGGETFQPADLHTAQGDPLGATAVTFDRGAPGVAYAAAPANPQRATVIFESRDAGVTWTPLAAEGLVNSFVQVLAVDEAGTLYAGTRGGGVYRLERDPL